MTSWRDTKISGGPQLVDGSVAHLLYKMALSESDLDAGLVIETTYSPDIPIVVTFAYDSVLPGIFSSALGMTSGGSVRRIWVSAEDAFGARGFKIVPPDSDLVVDLCLVAIVPSTP